MHDIYNISIKETLPSSIAADHNIQVLSELLTIKLLEIVPNIDSLAILPNLQNLSDAVLDELAWHLHVDFYEPTLERSQKETLIYQSITWHRRKGTIGIVEDMVKLISGYAEVVENWNYNGEPYHFKVQVESEDVLPPNEIDKVITSVDYVKNVRSWIDGIETRKYKRSNIYVAGRVALVNTYLEEVI